MTLRIAYPHNPIEAAMWFGALRFATGEDYIIASFEQDTGEQWIFSHKRSPLDAHIDNVTGREQVILDKFVDWFNVNCWGEDPFIHAEAKETDVSTLPGKKV